MASELPSIALFAYKRPQHTERTIRSLLRCKGAEHFMLHVFSDGAKTDADERDVEETRAILKTLLGERATFTFRNRNFGLARSIIAGVSELITSSGSVIVVEDDLELHPQFLEFMCGALHAYRDNEKVMQVSGFLLPADDFIPNSTCNFLPFTSSWGWATWERAWRMFDPQAIGWETLTNDAVVRKQFNLENTLDYATMLQTQMEGKIDSWAIRWYWTVFSNSGLIAYPPVNLVKNHGLDGSGTHGRWLAKRITKSQAFEANLCVAFPTTPEFSQDLYRAIIRQLDRNTSIRRSFLFRIPRQLLRSAISILRQIKSRGR